MFNQAEEHAMNVHILLTMQVIVIAVLFGASSLLSLVDGRETSSEVGSYLHYEYNASMLSRL